MKNRRLFIALLVTLSIASAITSAAWAKKVLKSVGQGTLPKSEGQSTTQGEKEKVTLLINDAAVLKLLMLDLGLNVVKLGWNDRKLAKCGKEEISRAVRQRAMKYGYKSLEQLNSELANDARKRGGDATDFPEPLNVQGGVVEGCYAIIQLYEKPVEIIRWPKKSKLPAASFCCGSIGITYDQKTSAVIPSIKNGTKCIFRGSEYIFEDGNWHN